MITRNLAAALVAAGMFAIANLAQASTVDVMNDDHDSVANENANAISQFSNGYTSASTLLNDNVARTTTVPAIGGGTAQFTLVRKVTAVPEMSALFPILGMLVAVASTSILRRRRMAKVNS